VLHLVGQLLIYNVTCTYVSKKSKVAMTRNSVMRTCVQFWKEWGSNGWQNFPRFIFPSS